jgi:hypothetical protein
MNRLPTDINRGKLKLWLIEGGRKMMFTPTYHFTEKRMAALRTQTRIASPGHSGLLQVLKLPKGASISDKLTTPYSIVAVEADETGSENQTVGLECCRSFTI